MPIGGKHLLIVKPVSSLKLKQVLLRIVSKNGTFTRTIRTSCLKWLLFECVGGGATKRLLALFGMIYEDFIIEVLHLPLIHLKLALLDVEHQFQ